MARTSSITHCSITIESSISLPTTRHSSAIDVDGPISESSIFRGILCIYSGDEHLAAEITSSRRSSSTSMIEHTGESIVSATISAIACRIRSR